MTEYDLLLRGGTVVDPAAGLHTPRDVAVTGGKVAAICDPGTEQRARVIADVHGLLVVPGLIDMHVHVFPGVSHFGIDADSTCLARGVTTAVDFGTAGGLIFDGFRQFVIDQTETKLYALLCWTSDFDLHGRTVNLARNRKIETDRRIVDRIR